MNAGVPAVTPALQRRNILLFWQAFWLQPQAALRRQGSRKVGAFLDSRLRGNDKDAEPAWSVVHSVRGS